MYNFISTFFSCQVFLQKENVFPYLDMKKLFFKASRNNMWKWGELLVDHSEIPPEELVNLFLMACYDGYISFIERVCKFKIFIEFCVDF